MEGRCESDRGGDVYPATFGDEEKTGLKLDRTRRNKVSLVGEKLKNTKNKTYGYNVLRSDRFMVTQCESG